MTYWCQCNNKILRAFIHKIMIIKQSYFTGNRPLNQYLQNWIVDKWDELIQNNFEKTILG